jgi:hypothetical protein
MPDPEAWEDPVKVPPASKAAERRQKPCRLMIEMRYDDFALGEQDSPSRIEILEFPDRREAGKAQKAVEKMLDSDLRYKDLFMVYREPAKVPRGTTAKAVALAKRMFEEHYGEMALLVSRNPSSPRGETLEQAEVKFVSIKGRAPHREMVVEDPAKWPTGKFELWAEHPHCPHYHLLYAGTKFEFVRSAESPEKLNGR